MLNVQRTVSGVVLLAARSRARQLHAEINRLANAMGEMADLCGKHGNRWAEPLRTLGDSTDCFNQSVGWVR